MPLVSLPLIWLQVCGPAPCGLPASLPRSCGQRACLKPPCAPAPCGRLSFSGACLLGAGLLGHRPPRLADGTRGLARGLTDSTRSLPRNLACTCFLTRCALLPTRFSSHGFRSDSALLPHSTAQTDARTRANHASTWSRLAVPDGESMFFYHYTLFATESANSAVRFRTDIDAREHACCTARRPTGRLNLVPRPLSPRRR